MDEKDITDIYIIEDNLNYDMIDIDIDIIDRKCI